MAFKKLSLPQMSALIRDGIERQYVWERWKDLSLTKQREELAEYNADRRANYDDQQRALKAAKAAQKAAAKGSRGKKASSSRKSAGENEDAFTRQNRMSQSDWNQMFHAP